MEPAKFRKKPVVIEALQYTGENQDDICNILNLVAYHLSPEKEMLFHTVPGDVLVKVGEWVIRERDGYCTTRHPDDFLAEYESVFEGELNPAHTLEEDFAHFLSYAGLTHEKPGHRD